MSNVDEQVLIVAVNWIGDTIMAMPAVQAYRAAHPRACMTVLAKPAVMPLWEVHAAPDRRIPFLAGSKGTWQTVRKLRQSGPYDRAFILPNSFRSALIPWLAGVPHRIAVPGHGRGWMITESVQTLAAAAAGHQSNEYARLLLGGIPCPPPLPAPRLDLPKEAFAQIAAYVSDRPRPLIGLIPGAARGPSKQWPPGYFVEVGRQLCQQDSMGVIVIGSPAERVLCEDVAAGIGDPAKAIAGRTNLIQWMALLASCDVVIANDSGAMHVAAALDTGVVAIFGITDPARTGPLGANSIVLQKSTQRNRDIPRVSAAATAALEAVQPQEVCESVHQLLARKGRVI